MSDNDNTITFQITIKLPKEIPLYANPKMAARMTLLDALSEFQGHRRPIKHYMERRYPLSEGYEWLDREKKEHQIYERCRLAQAMAENVTIIENKEEGK